MKKMYFVSYYCHPMNLIAVDRVSKFLKTFLDDGYHIKFFTMDYNYFKQKNILSNDQSMFESEIEFCYIKPSHRFLVEYYNDKKSSFFIKMVRSFFALFILRDNCGITWYKNLKKKLIQSLKKEKPDVIFSTGGPYLQFSFIAQLAVKNNIPYILDYRDLWFNNPAKRFNIPPLFVKNIEKRCIENAVLVTSATKGILDELNPRVGRVLYNLPSTAYIDFVLKSANEGRRVEKTDLKKQLSFCYSGTIYEKNCSFKTVFEAILRLCSEYHNDITVVFHYCGRSSDRFLHEAYPYKEKITIIDHGFLAKKEAISLMSACDVMVSLVDKNTVSENNAAGIVTTKIFDYIILSKPILNISSENSEINHVVRDVLNYPYFYTTAYSDTPKIKQCLIDIYEAKQKDLFSVEKYNFHTTWEAQYEKTLKRFIT